jgi:ATP-binding cassette subfamily B protein
MSDQRTDDHDDRDRDEDGREALDGRTPAEKRVGRGSTTEGVRGEERDDFTRDESKRLRGRSLRLLGSLVHPSSWASSSSSASAPRWPARR